MIHYREEGLFVVCHLFCHWWLTCPTLQLLSRFFTEPCEDVPSYEFSCPRWQAQGYCEKRQKEMQVVCRKTCGFCGEWAGVLRKKALVFGLCSTRRLRDGRLVNYRSASPWNECTLVDVLVLFFLELCRISTSPIYYPTSEANKFSATRRVWQPVMPKKLFQTLCI